MWFIKIMVRFFFTIDSALFNFIATLYDLLIAISRTSVLSQGDIAQFATRIEILLGIFMLFKMSFSLITYIVNPDDFTDKQKGFGKLVQNSVISLVLLVLVPYIFQMAFSLQAKILNDNLLAKLLLGERINDEEGDGNKKVTIIDTAGNEMAFQIMLPFFSPNVALDGVGDCVNLYDATGTKFNDTCKEALRSAGMESTTDEQGSQYGPWLENYVAGVENRSLGLTFRLDAALDTADYNKGEEADDFVIDYKYPLSTAAAVITCLLLITFCIDIGVRSVKLAFLQLIYPIPVISFMDPKSGKDGIFSKWYKMCLSTFLSLFIRLLALYFGVYIITRVGRHGIIDVINGSEITAGWVKLFVIIGILMFVKQLPKILENLGVKIDGDGTFNLNPLKKVMDEKNGVFGAKQIKRAGVAAGAAGLAGAAAMGTNALTGAQRFRDAKGFKGKAKALFGGAGSMLAGGMSGLTRGARAGLKGEKFGKAYSDSYSTAMKNKQARSDRIGDNVKWGEMIGSKARQKMGLHTRGETVTSATENIKKMQDTYSQMMKAAEGMDSARDSITANAGGRLNGMSFNGIKGLAKYEEQLKKTSIDRGSFTSEAAYNNAVKAQQEALDEIDDLKKNRLDAIASGSVSIDAATQSAIQQGYTQMQSLAGEINDATRKIDSSISTINAGDSASKMNGVSKGVNSQLSINQEARHAQTVDQYGAKKDAK